MADEFEDTIPDSELEDNTGAEQIAAGNSTADHPKLLTEQELESDGETEYNENSDNNSSSTDKKAKKDKSKENIFINNTNYNISFKLVNKQQIDKSEPIIIPWSNIEKFEYIDDVIDIGLYGSLILIDTGNVFSSGILQNIDRFLLKVELVNVKEICNYSTLIYFNVLKIENIINQNTSSTSKYSLTLIESFVGEGNVRNYKTCEYNFLNNNGGSYDGTSKGFEYPSMVSNLKSFILDTPNQYDPSLGNDITLLEMSEDFKNIIEIDDISLKNFQNDEEINKTADIGKGISDEASTIDTCASVFQDLNFNFFCNPDNLQDNNQIYNFGFVRMENIFGTVGYDDDSSKAYIDKKLVGKRKIVFKIIKDLFGQCFRNKRIYEIFLNVNKTYSEKELKNLPNALFFSSNQFNNVNIIPINNSITSQEWCDIIITDVCDTASTETTYYRFKDILDYYQKNYLCENTNYNVPINFTEYYKFKGISRKLPLLESDNLKEQLSGKILRNIILLNNIVKINLPGNIFRKANEIVYIDNNMTKNSASGANPVYNNAFKDNYYYVSRVVHTFSGNIYNNELNLSNICYKK